MLVRGVPLKYSKNATAFWLAPLSALSGHLISAPSHASLLKEDCNTALLHVCAPAFDAVCPGSVFSEQRWQILVLASQMDRARVYRDYCAYLSEDWYLQLVHSSHFPILMLFFVLMIRGVNDCFGNTSIVLAALFSAYMKLWSDNAPALTHFRLGCN